MAKARGPRLPESIQSLEDVAAFFAHLFLVDNTSFHPDDRFYDEGSRRVAYVDARGLPAYTVRDARLRDRLMAEAWDVTSQEGVDISGVALWVGAVLGVQDDPESKAEAPEWLRRKLAPWAAR